MKVSDRVFARFLGQAIRDVREARGWTRAQLAARLSGIGERAVLTYELGTRFVTAVRLVEICRVLGVSASEVMGQAEAAAADATLHTLTVDLCAVARDGREGFEVIASWARRRDGDTVRLEPATVREMAAMLGFEHRVLAAYLAEFSVDE